MSEPQFNFDLEKMQDAINSGVISLPNGLSGEDRKAFIIAKLPLFDEDTELCIAALNNVFGEAQLVVNAVAIEQGYGNFVMGAVRFKFPPIPGTAYDEHTDKIVEVPEDRDAYEERIKALYVCIRKASERSLQLTTAKTRMGKTDMHRLIPPARFDVI
jgi:hypothetical protein